MYAIPARGNCIHQSVAPPTGVRKKLSGVRADFCAIPSGTLFENPWDPPYTSQKFSYTSRWRHRLVYAIPANGNSILHSEPESSANYLCCKWQSSWKCVKQPNPNKTYKQKQQKTSSDRRLSITYSNYSISSNSSIHSNDNAHIVILASLVILVSPVSLVSLVILIILVSLVNSNNSSISSNSRVLDATQMLRFWLRSVSRVRVRLIRKRM